MKLSCWNNTSFKVAKNLHLHVESHLHPISCQAPPYIYCIFYKFNGSWLFNFAIKPEDGEDLQDPPKINPGITTIIERNEIEGRG